MESVTATVVRSPFGVSGPSNSAGRSGILIANGPDFVRFRTKFLPSIKVRDRFCLGFVGFKVYAWSSDEYNETLFKETQKWAK